MEEAERMRALEYYGFARDHEDASQMVDQQITYERSGEDDPDSEGFLLRERLRSRKPEEIESFDINADGLAIHGTEVSLVESILRGGIGYKGKDGSIFYKNGIWYNLVGHAANRESEEQKKIGFGPNRTRFGKRVIFVTDIFKQLWPNEVNAALTCETGWATGGEICVKFPKNPEGRGWSDRMAAIFERRGPEIDWSTYKSVPPSNRVLIPEFKPEKEEVYDSRRGIKSYRKGGLISDSLETNRRAFRQLLSPNTFNAIVVSDDTQQELDGDGKRPTKEIVEEIIAIQNKLYPKNEHIPIYSEDGKCLYNPLKV